ncbi:CesT family type III secretion system chaperone [Herbaspirillum sp. alder98]|uniref:CesT family type III secretion system chaperone n=1 Tax=Herbaspirillum sp. alder98 TaxID=2913096 RepID=UPI001CD8C529|nr:CesT family type III secretion system chaperone [Herbaspirillum sp. alder98]MCA1324573.1 CesT family type III secretion system chaperone [Herbaspirillum sp. alder98]
MSIHRYHALIDHLCEQLSIEFKPAMYQAAQINVDGVDFTLFHAGLMLPESVQMHCDFGALPGAAREAVLLRLLETQTHLFGVCAPVFSYDRTRDSVALMCRFPLHDEDGAVSTLELLRFFSGLAKRWRQDRFTFVQ